jgi:hypothetical protein
MTKPAFRGLIVAAALVAAVALFAAACGSAAPTTTTSAAPAQTTSTAASDDPSTSSAVIDETASSSADDTTATVAGGNIVVSGLVDYPMTFTALDMDYMNWVTATVDDPTSGSTSVDGVALIDVFSYFGVQDAATTVVITGADGSAAEITLADMPSDALLVVADDSSMSTAMPGMASDAWVKNIATMEFK